MLTLDDRAKFESLLTEFANASMDELRAAGRRHDAMHRLLAYVNDRTKQAYHEGIDMGVAKTASPLVHPHDCVCGECGPVGHDHAQPIPQEHCVCAVCRETRERQRTAAAILAVGAPISDTSGGN